MAATLAAVDSTDGRRVPLAEQDYATMESLRARLRKAEADGGTVRVWAVIPVHDVPYLLFCEGSPSDEGTQMRQCIGCELLQYVPLLNDLGPDLSETQTGYGAWLDEEGMYRQPENFLATELLIEHPIKDGKRPHVYGLCVHGPVIICADPLE